MTQSIREIERLTRGRDTGQVVIHFPSDQFLLIQMAVGAPCSVYAFKEYVDDHTDTSIVIILIGAAIMLARAIFKTRPPEWRIG